MSGVNIQVGKPAAVAEMLLNYSGQIELCLPQCSLVEINGESQTVVDQFHCRLNVVILHSGCQCVGLPPQVPQSRQQVLQLDDWKKKGLKGQVFWWQGHVVHKAGINKNHIVQCVNIYMGGQSWWDEKF